VVADNATSALIGSSRYYDWDPAKREVAIGFTFLARSHWGGTANAEMKKLMLDHAFRFADVVWFHVGATNTRSRKAMEKIGGHLAYEAPRVLAGVEHMYCYYRIDAPR
jgi:N-acetyltransferase